MLGAAEQLLSFALGSPGYRAAHRRSASAAVAELGPLRAAKLLELGHLGGTLPESTLSDSLETLREHLGTIVTYQMLHSMVVRDEIARIAAQFNVHGATPVLLKGCGLWGRDWQPWERRVQDVDILVDNTELDGGCQALRALGYKTRDGCMPSPVGWGGHYHHPPVLRTLQIDAPNLAVVVDRMQSMSPYHLKFFDDGGWRIQIDVELHRGLFVYKDGSALTKGALSTEPHKILHGALTVRRVACLPYTAVKLVMDLEELADGKLLKIKSLKLCADLVALLISASPDEIAESLELAMKWNCGALYARALSAIAYLIPEVEMCAKDVGEDILLRSLQVASCHALILGNQTE